jgi:hypothetical protein
MIFLIEYKRSEGRVISRRTFDDTQLRMAQDSRLELEIDLHRRGIDHEVVLLDAENEAALHLTHRRYFATLPELLQSVSDQLEATAPATSPTVPSTR